MSRGKKTFYRVLVFGFLFTLFLRERASAETSGAIPEVTFEKGRGEMILSVGRQPVARYVWEDPDIPRPYFCDVKTPSGIQATRNHPPIEGVDRTDHPTYHPGIWLAFGDLSGEDFWRLKARVRQDTLTLLPVSQAGSGAFEVSNVYLGSDGREICREKCRYGLYVIEEENETLGYLLTQDSVFQSNRGSFVFGDQEEMGFAVRVATPLNVKEGGTLINSNGQKNQEEAWGKIADWCDYSGTIDGMKVGMTLIPDPDNFRKSWFHARDYGVLLANPFGRKAYTGGEASAVEVKPGETFRYRNGVFIYSLPERDETIPQRGYEAYLSVRQLGSNSR